MSSRGKKEIQRADKERAGHQVSSEGSEEKEGDAGEDTQKRYDFGQRKTVERYQAPLESRSSPVRRRYSEINRAQAQVPCCKKNTRMAQRPPSRPRVAWEEDGAPQQSSSPPEPYERCMVQALRVDASWLPVYKVEQKAVDFIQAFVSSPEKEEHQKLEFLRCICTLCRTARQRGLSQGLDVFCHSYKLAENIKVLLAEEPVGQPCVTLRIEAMLAIAELSSVQTVLEGKETSFLEALFSGVFLIHLTEEVKSLQKNLYYRTLSTMNTMLEMLVLSIPASRVNEELHKIFQVLLNLPNSERLGVQVVALEGIVRLSHLLARKPTREECRHPARDLNDLLFSGNIQIPILGQLLGRLFLLRYSKELTSVQALDALLHLYEFIWNQESSSALRDPAQQPHWRPEPPYIWIVLTTRDFIMKFAKCLKPCERTDIVLVAIEAMRECSMCDTEAARSLLEVFMRDPETWLADVPQIMNCIQENTGCITMESARQSVESLRLLLTDQSPMQEPQETCAVQALRVGGAPEGGVFLSTQPSSGRDTALQDTAQHIVREVLGNAVAAIQGPGQQPAEQRELAQGMGAEAAARTPAAPQDTEPALAGEPQGEPGTARGGAQPSSGCRALPEDDPGIAALPHAPAGRRQPSLFRRALRALRRAFCCSCIAGQAEQQSPAAGTGQVSEDGGRP